MNTQTFKRMLLWFMAQRCVACGDWGTDWLCTPCREMGRRPPPNGPLPLGVEAVVAGAAYLGVVRACVVGLKFGGRRAIAPWLAEPIAHSPDLPGTDWLLVPVPMTRLATWRRGYNQAAMLAQAIAKRTGHRVSPLLRRTRATAAQRFLPRHARTRNTAGAFVAAPLPPGTRIILVDDVLTTGATAGACALALHQAGAEAVVLAVAARTPKR